MDAEKNMKEIQKTADNFICKSIALYDDVLSKSLKANDFELVQHINDSKFVELNNNFYPVSYNYYKWNSESKGTLNWFVLQSTFLYASNIVACLAFPKQGTKPILSMNLNLKLDAKTFSIILGFKNDEANNESTSKYFDELNYFEEQPVFVDSNRLKFNGIRASYKITDNIIEKTLSKAETHILKWLNIPDNYNSCATVNDKYFKEKGDYTKDLEFLHNQQNTIYDEIFGNNWLINLFKKQIL